MFLRKLLTLAILVVAGCAVAPDAVRRMDATRIQAISDYRLCDAAAVNLDLRGQRYPVIENEIARRGVSCDEHIAAVVSDCSRLQVVRSGIDSTEQGIIFTVRNDSDQAQSFRIRREERQSRLFTIGPGTTEQFGITADPNVTQLGEPIESVEGDGGIELLECRAVRDNYRFNYRPQAGSAPEAANANEGAPQASSAEPGVRSRATRNVNMRAGPGTNHAVVRTLRAGEEVTVLRVVGTWCECMASGGVRAYVSCAFLSPPSGGWGSLRPVAADRGSPRPPEPFPPDYGTAYASYLAALNPRQRTIPWLARMEGVVSPGGPIRIGGTSARWISSCKPHDCGENQVVIFLLPDRRSVRAVLRLNGVEQLLAGAGAAEAACVRDLFNSGWTIGTCGRPAVTRNGAGASGQDLVRQRFPGWTVRRASPELCNPGQDLSGVVSGDFDGDRAPDYALRIVRGAEGQIVALMSNGGGRVSTIVLQHDTSSGITYYQLGIARRGSRHSVIANLDRGTYRTITLANDAPTGAHCSSSAWIYLIQGTTFTRAFTSD